MLHAPHSNDHLIKYLVCFLRGIPCHSMDSSSVYVPRPNEPCSVPHTGWLYSSKSLPFPAAGLDAVAAAKHMLCFILLVLDVNGLFWRAFLPKSAEECKALKECSWWQHCPEKQAGACLSEIICMIYLLFPDTLLPQNCTLLTFQSDHAAKVARCAESNLSSTSTQKKYPQCVRFCFLVLQQASDQLAILQSQLVVS